MLFSLTGDAPAVTETWEWDPGTPGLRMSAHLQPAFGAQPFDCRLRRGPRERGPASDLPVATCPIREIEIHAVVGGMSEGGPGVELDVWTGLGWETVVENDAATEQPGGLTYVYPNDDEADPLAGLDLRRLVFGKLANDQAVNVRVKPKHRSGPRRLGELVAEDLEVRVRYSHPEPEQ